MNLASFVMRSSETEVKSPPWLLLKSTEIVEPDNLESGVAAI